MIFPNVSLMCYRSLWKLASVEMKSDCQYDLCIYVYELFYSTREINLSKYNTTSQRM